MRVWICINVSMFPARHLLLNLVVNCPGGIDLFDVTVLFFGAGFDVQFQLFPILELRTLFACEKRVAENGIPIQEDAYRRMLLSSCAGCN